ncbi:hypothetical protein [Clostridium sp. HBUAS56010]|uniref:hypothetical protein n=1 Tax=Clostridium sp. HBUAS56010 TaxID=2571127 RepID=UPI0011788AF6|nr:hypothetical protein [Clostridium sp. HBUAS56010]
MANETKNYKFLKPETDDFYDIREYNKTMDALDDSLTEMNESKLDKAGDASQAVTEFEEEVLRENIESGETLSTTHGKVKKWFSEMKDVAFSGKAKDIIPDAAHRFVTEKEKGDWNGKVAALGGDISETVIETLETGNEQYPIPEAGETAKVYMAKVKRFMEHVKPLEADMTVYVATTGSDIEGDGTEIAPYKTITYALSKIPKTLSGYTASVVVAGGTYPEDLVISGFTGGLQLLLSGDITVTSIIVNKTTLTCRSFDTTSHTITSRWISVTNYASWTSYLQINIMLTGSFNPSDHEVSFYASLCSKIYATGNITFTGNTDVAIYLSASSTGYFGTITGSGFAVGTVLRLNSQVSWQKNDLSAITPTETTARNSSIVVSHYGGVIGTLPYNTTWYVSATGSDEFGTGTEAQPLKTIQKALTMIPKDLGGHQVVISVANGVYDESVNVVGYYNGYLTITSKSPDVISSSVTVDRMDISYCTASISVKGIKFSNTTNVSAVFIISSSDVYLHYLQIANSSSNTGVYASKGIHIKLYHCDLSFRNKAIEFMDSSGYIWDCTGSSNTTGISTLGDATIKVIGTSPGSTNGIVRSGGAALFNESGTQISAIISSGLSCTWGKINTGGYIRNGNVSGTAMVTINIHLSCITTLSAGVLYQLHGFPKEVVIDTAVSPSQVNEIGSCYIRNGNIQIYPLVNLPIGYSFSLNCTYLTNS